MPFTNVKFLKNIEQQTRKSARLKKWLVLFTRLLAFAALIIAFAQPYFAKNNATKNYNTTFYLDNSFSMQAQGQDGDLLNEVKNKAIDLVKSLDENEKVNLLTTDLLAKDQRFYSKSEIIERIKEIDLTGIQGKLFIPFSELTTLKNRVLLILNNYRLIPFLIVRLFAFR